MLLAPYQQLRRAALFGWKTNLFSNKLFVKVSCATMPSTLIESELFGHEKGGENGIEELICPNCIQDISSQDWNFPGEWNDNKSNNLTCPLCETGTDIH